MGKKTILIVDDNADTRLVLSARLKANHYHTIFAADALQAMCVARKDPQISQTGVPHPRIF